MPLETHGGYGEVWKRVYSGIPRGVVIEKAAEKTAVLARQRPGWIVFEGRAEQVIGSGVLRGLGVDFIDCDPYGSPWGVLTAALGSIDGPLIGVVVNDGMRQRLRIKQGWTSKALAEEVLRYGNERLFADYLEVCREKLGGLLAAAGFDLAWWAGYYTGHNHDMTHYGAVGVRRDPPDGPGAGAAGWGSPREGGDADPS